jgi:tetratricopeptide (TPR) repeat protein
LAVHYFSGQSDKNGMQAVMTKVEDVSRATDNPSPQPTTSVIALNRAEELEKQERYDEAIVAYESYLWRNPDAGDADKVGARIAEIRRFLRAMEAAKAAASGNRLMTARQHYTDALLIIPDSQLARTGLAEVEYKIAALRR